MKLSEIVRGNPEAAKELYKKGLFCLGCPMAMTETLEQGALSHGLNPEELVKELNKQKN